MKFNLNAKELLALHNLLSSKYTYEDSQLYKKDDPRAADDAQLRQVFNRLRACIIASLTNKQVDLFEGFMKREQEKIDRLSEELDKVKDEQQDLAAHDGDFFVPKDDDLDVPTDYPRKGQRNRNNRGGNKR